MSSILLLPSHSPCPHHFLSAPSPGPIPQYQLYAVEKWIVQRKQNTFLLVFTGIPDHAVSLDAYVPDPAHDPHAAWDAAIALLRADGAKPKLTAHGTLMVTSLAHFRSDYTIVHIPSGNFLHVRDHLYANINLLRMGCSGRSALTLEDPSDSTKDRFIYSYHLPDSSIPLPTSIEHLPLRSPEKPLPKRKDRPSFVATVLELVKLIHASLAIFGMFPLPSSDGLLCDESVDGIKHWIAHIGGPCIGLEPSERIADPVFVSAILSLVLSTRNKLAHLGYSFILPRDPFLYPHAFSLALTAYIQSTPVVPPHSPHLIPPAPPSTTILSAAAASAAAIAAPLPLLSPNAILTRDLLQSISSSYDAKLKSESRKVRRVIKNKLAPSSTVDSDGADPDRDHPRDPRRHTLSLSLSGGEGPTDRSPIVGAAGPSAGVGSGTGSGGQILSGIGSLASGLRIGGTTGGPHGDPGLLMAPTLDLHALVAFVVGGQGPSKRRRDKKKDKEAADPNPAIAVTVVPPAGAVGLAYTERDAVVAGSVKALWSGRIADLIKMREDLDGAASVAGLGTDDRRWLGSGVRSNSGFDRDTSTRWKRQHRPNLSMSVVSDGDAEDHYDNREKRYDGRSTEEESDVFINPSPPGHHSFSGMWGGRMRGKLGNWAAYVTHTLPLFISLSKSC
ncbi:hypothetical protein M413DRAFT_441236 [Hebeloma cylindrosporum]|uniref:STB6-like N-terminal domain-containing protein n=1 Tax=Hebeloma cylindrosporum TaxID=76867 RepID=A0A0C3CQN7_HEBCY|nr:hypothetical protein M413DRAFT_441236 [Hebeloma cylindrosporum h7]